ARMPVPQIQEIEAIEEPEIATRLHTPGASQPPPQLAFAMAAQSIPARVSSLPDDAALDAMRREREKAANAGSWRFILAAAGFVGVLGLIAALLVKDSPANPKPSARETAAAIDNSQPVVPTPTVLLPSGVSTTTPIIDIGDLDDSKPGHTGKPRVKRPAGAPRTANTTATPAAASTASKSGGDLAGPVKVWK
ncbi:MAG: hypothetical protein K0S65_4226, partial [Labilithrix sp.]|nr:hypothetical protein [Labilithrix sp.]